MFYVYKWYIIDTGEIFYIGKGCNKRAGQTSKRNKLFKETLQNNECNYEIIKYFDNEEDAFKYEHEMICNLKSINQCKCNLDNGGVGGVQFIWTDEMKSYYSKYNGMKSAKQRERMSTNNPMKNKEVRDKVAKSLRKHPVINDEYFESVKDASIKYNVSTCTIRQWCKNGVNPYNQKCHWSNESEKDVQYIRSQCKKVIYKDTQYNSVKELCDYLHIAKSTARSWLKRGFDTKGNKCRYVNDTINYIYNEKITSSKPVIINNVWYKSVIDACRQLNIREQTLRYHLKNKTGRYDFKYDNQ